MLTRFEVVFVVVSTEGTNSYPLALHVILVGFFFFSKGKISVGYLQKKKADAEDRPRFSWMTNQRIMFFLTCRLFDCAGIFLGSIVIFRVSPNQLGLLELGPFQFWTYTGL